LSTAIFTGFTEGGAGAEALAHAVVAMTNRPQPPVRYLYDLNDSPEEKIAAVASTIYGASEVEFSRTAQKDLERIRALGYDRLPVCIAKTHLSLSSDPAKVGHPEAFPLPVESVRIAAGAGYLLVMTGDIVTMPGLPHDPAAHRIDLSDDGGIMGV